MIWIFLDSAKKSLFKVSGQRAIRAGGSALKTATSTIGARMHKRAPFHKKKSLRTVLRTFFRRRKKIVAMVSSGGSGGGGGGG